MTLALVALTVLAVVIFAFVLEPVVRAHGDRAVLDAAALPERDTPFDNDERVEQAEVEPLPETAGEDRLSGRRVSVDRPASSDAS